jgi:predicted LPLAT superfamily acyltransferase
LGFTLIDRFNCSARLKKAKVVHVKKNKDANEAAKALKDIEKALFAIRFYPVAVDEEAKNLAIEKLASVHNKGNDTVRQMVLYMIHEALAKTSEFRVMHTQEYFKMKEQKDSSQSRMSVYRAIFNYNTSVEGACELYLLLGRLNMDDAAKLLTYHYSRLCAMENESNHMLRSAVVEALGVSESRYALNSLLEYAKYSDNERNLSRILAALYEWQNKIEVMKLKQSEKDELKARMQEVIRKKETGGTHYG